jgi:uncharacterized protein (DUF1697 family)
MPAYAGLLRAINVGGTGRLPMSDLRELCLGCKFSAVTTYIQSGNVVFKSPRSEAGARKALEAALAEHLGKPYGVFIRQAPELAALLSDLPFPSAAPGRVHVLFLDEPPSQADLSTVVSPDGEEVRARGRHLIIHYPSGIGRTRLKLPFAKNATMRNLNTVRKLLGMLEALER